MGPFEGYPDWVMLTLIVGSVVAALGGWRPLFYYSFMGLLLADIPAYTYSRFELTGPYLNLFDVFTVGSLCAAMGARGGTKRSAGRMLAAMAITLAVGYAVSVLDLGFRYEGLRELRKAVAFPVLFWVGYRCCITKEDRRRILALIVLACGVQSLRQWMYVWGFADQSATAWRTLRFMHSGLAFPAMVLLVRPLWKAGWARALIIACVGVAFVAMILTQTRSLWVPQAIMALWILVAWGLGGGPRGWLVTGIGIVGIVGAAYLFERTALVPIDLEELFWQGHATDFSSGTGREEAIRAELDAWWNGGLTGIIVGRGLGFYWNEAYDWQQEVAWGHNGYTAYLSNLGLLGFVVFAVWFPWAALRRSRVALKAGAEEDRAFAAVYLMFLAFVVLQSALSSGLLSGWLFGLFAMLSGALWRLTQMDPLGSRPVSVRGPGHSPLVRHSRPWAATAG
jgi:hypothetical protein